MKIIDEFTDLDISKEERFILRHPKYKVIYNRNWYLGHIEHRKEQSMDWRLKNPERFKEIQSHFSYPEKVKEWREKHSEKIKAYHLKRERGLGFEILWEDDEIEEPMNFHHIDKIYVVTIPKKIHKSVNHNVFTGKGMKEINQLAFNYIMSRGEN